MMQFCSLFICFGFKETLQHAKANMITSTSTGENLDGWEWASASRTVSLRESDGATEKGTTSGFTVSWQKRYAFLILTKSLQVHKLLLSWSVSSSRQFEVLGWRRDEFHAAENQANRIKSKWWLLEKHNLYESGRACICKHVRPPLLPAFCIFTVSRRARERCWWTLCLDKSGNLISPGKCDFFYSPPPPPSSVAVVFLKLWSEVTAKRFPRSDVAQ